MATIRRLTSTSMFLMQTKMLSVPVGATLLEKPRALVGRWQMHIQHEAELREPSSFQKRGPEEKVTLPQALVVALPREQEVWLSSPPQPATEPATGPGTEDGSQKQWYSIKVLMLQIKGDLMHGLYIALGCFDPKVYKCWKPEQLGLDPFFPSYNTSLKSSKYSLLLYIPTLTCP